MVGVTSLNENAALQPAIIWPSCVKNDNEGTINIISEINDVMKTKYGYPIVNFCIDGDSNRRRVANVLMCHDASDFEWYWLVDNLPPVDYLVGPNGESTNFDEKHLAERSWCMLLREKVTIDCIYQKLN